MSTGGRGPTEPAADEGRAFARGALAGLIGRGLGFGMQYAFLAVVGRALGAAPAAPFYAVLATATVLAVAGRAGLDRFGLREISAAIAHARSSVIRPLTVRLLGLQILWSALLVSAAIALRARVAALLELDGTTMVFWLAALALGIVVTNSLSEYVLAFRSVVASAMVRSIVPYGLACGLLLGAGIRGTPLQGSQVAATLLAGLALATVAGGAIIWRKTANVERGSRASLPTVQIGSAVALAAVPLLMLGMTGLDVVLLQAADPGAGTSYYQAAQRTAMTLTLGLLGINAIAAPMVAAAFAMGRSIELERVVQRASRWSLSQAAAIAILLIVSGKWILQLFGAEFQRGYPILLVLIVAQLANSAAGPVVQLFIMTGHERAAFAVLLPIVIVTVPCYYLAGQSMGAIGVAAVTATAFIAWNGALVVLARRRFGIWSHADNWPLAATFVFGAAVLAALVTSGRLSPWGLGYVVASCFGLWRSCLTGEDRELLLETVAGGRGTGGK